MEIELKNFKIWTHKIITISPGLTLFDGISGVGKSSILEAIIFAITGKGKNIIKNNMSSCQVILSIVDTVIIRNKRPNTLVVKIEGKEFIEREAQSHINLIFNNLFSSIGYIKQGISDTFLDKSSSDKFLMLEDLAFNGINLSQIKKKLADEIRKFKNEFVCISAKLDILEKTEIKKPAEIIPRNDIAHNKDKYTKRNNLLIKNLKTLILRIENLEEEYCISKNLEGEKNTCTALKLTFQKELEGLDVKESIVSLEQKIHSYQEQLEKVEMQLNYDRCRKLCTELEKQIIADKKMKEQKILEYKNQILSDEEFKTITERVKCFKAQQKIHLDIERLLKEKKEIDYRPNREGKTNRILLECSEELEKLSGKLQKLKIQEIKLCCPNCNKDVFLSDNQLIIAEDIIDKEDYSKLRKKYEKVVSKNKERLKIKERYSRQRIKCDIIETSIEELESQKLEEICINIEELEAKLKNHVKSNYLLKELQSIPLNITSAYDEAKIHLDTLTDYKIVEAEEKTKLLKIKLQKIRTQCDICRVKNERSIELQRLINLKEEELKAIADFSPSERINRELIHYRLQLKKLHEKKNKTEQILFDIEKYILYKVQFTEYKKRQEILSDLNLEKKKTNEYLSGAENLSSMIKTNESKCLASFINKLEQIIQIYLNHFFMDDTMTITINRFKTKVNKEIKPDIHIVLDYKGMALSIENLSGGELQKLKIACTLAFSTLFPSPIILLDECTSNLDQVATRLIMDTIRKFHQEKTVIIIAHQTVSGLYDNILKIE